MSDISDISAIAELYMASKRIPTSDLTLASALKAPLNSIGRGGLGSSYECTFVDSGNPHNRVTFSTGDLGESLMSMTATASMDDSNALLEVLDGELVIAFNSLYIPVDDLKKHHLKKGRYAKYGDEERRIYLTVNNLHLEHKTMEGREHILRGHFYTFHKGAVLPVRLSSLRPFKQSEQSFIDMADFLEITEMQYPYGSQLNPGHLHKTLIDRNNKRFAYSMASISGNPMELSRAEECANVLDVWKIQVSRDVYMSGAVPL